MVGRFAARLLYLLVLPYFPYSYQHCKSFNSFYLVNIWETSKFKSEIMKQLEVSTRFAAANLFVSDHYISHPAHYMHVGTV